ncbi:MAG: S8 family serine peptidase [Phycisphaerales bacterium]|nr:S8 family serine peptidase [Phycisphaerales bacterium]
MSNARTRFGSLAARTLAPALLLAVAGQATLAAGPIVFRSGQAVVVRAASPMAAAQQVEAMSPRTGAKRILVQFDQPVTPAQRASLKDAGLTLLSYVGSDAYFATVHAGQVNSAKLAASGAQMTVATELDPVWKLNEDFALGRVPEHAVVGVTEAQANQPSEKIIGAYMVFHQDVDLGEGAKIAELEGATVRDQLESINGLVVELPVSSVMALALHDEVQWLEPALPKFEANNIENASLTGANLAHSAPHSLTGAGVTAFVYDGGTALASHTAFGGRVTVIDSSGLNDHSTHVAGTIGASLASSFPGMAPSVDIVSAGFQYDGSGTFLYTNPGDIESDYANAFNNFNADVANNSIGTNTSINGFPCSIEGDYGVTSGVIDGVVRGNVTGGNPTRIVWANGNERQVSTCGSTYHTTAPPACAKNHITVGATNANNDSITSFSSWGPADDDRIKPDISAPGCQSNGDNGVTSTSSSGGYNVKCGTSMAAPTVTGCVALMLEKHRQLFPGAPDPRNSTIKALLAHNAQDQGNVGPDYQYGYGSVRIIPTLDFMDTLSYVEDTVDQGGTVSQGVTVGSGSGPIKFTLAWDDAPAAPNPVAALVNDLDLVVTDPNGTRHYPWTLGGNANPSAAAVRTQEDHINNIEQVQIDAPIPGLWTIAVTGTNVPQGPQEFSLTADGGGLAGMAVTLLTPVPALIAPGSNIPLTVGVVANNQSVIAGSVRVHYRYDGGTYLQLVMNDNLDDTYSVSLPAVDCGDLPELYFTAEGTSTGQATSPASGAADPISTEVGVETFPVVEEMEAGTSGWVVDVGLSDPQATTGNWNRMDPQGTSAQPEDDHTPSGTDCWVTDGNAGASVGAFDIDNGATNLTSPSFALAAFPEARLSYWRWYNNNAGASPGEDIFVVEVSNNAGGSWTTVETVSGDQGGGWVQHEFRVADFVAPTDQVQMRFTASDLINGSIVEAAIDDLQVVEQNCTSVGPTCPGDANGDLLVDLTDLNLVLFNFGSAVPADTNGDVNGDGFVDLDDLNLVLFNFGAVC